MGKTSKNGEPEPKTGKKTRKKKAAKKKATRRKPPPVRRKGPSAKFIGLLILVLLLAGIGKMTQLSLKAADDKKITKRYGLLVSSLDKLYFGCTVYWSGEGRGEDCSQDIWKRISGPRFDEIKITILKGQRHEFVAQAKHAKNDKVFQIDHKGDVYLNMDGCLPKMTFNAMTLENMQSLEQQCQTKKPPPAK